ncbi:MAG: SDR family NAD(P)-dependent oxidoreductase, partial [Actinobacteria bacterium]|nr:SDR family NAD(P)-dependent oxidoreductase [Actinomycetota bacterium]
AEVEEMVRTNVLGQVWSCKAVLPHMMERGSGHLVVMSSTNGRIPPPLQSVYNATKFAAIGLGETLLYEVEPFGIGVTIVYPGAIDTPFFAPPEFGRMRTPKKIAPDRMGKAICDGIERGAYDVSLPRVLRLPAMMRVLAPPLVRKGVRKYAASVVPRPPK